MVHNTPHNPEPVANISQTLYNFEIGDEIHVSHETETQTGTVGMPKWNNEPEGGCVRYAGNVWTKISIGRLVWVPEVFVDAVSM